MTEHSLPEESIFLQALDFRSTADCAAFLDRACGENRQLREEVEALLRANQKSGDLLDLSESPALAKTVNEPNAERPFSEGPGSQIGAYKLLEQIGEGGFGVVFMAEQTQPVKRRVALKVIKPGMDTEQVIARFEAERQTLALMDHPYIAKVFDGGMTPSGRPYFVMELVKGAPITEYCDQKQLAPRERLELFVAVCQAVQHAHQKGIIHRDIKPSNVLITLHDDKPVVKVIDFGIAKATGRQTLTDKTLFTRFAQMVGTPLYMSPEQAELSGMDVDTRSDIYSLGVLLYELLTGTTPFDKDRMKAAAYDEIRRIIREDEPQKPSTRLSELGRAESTDRTAGRSPSSSLGTSLTSISAVRRMEPRKLAQLLRGDLDWIVMKTLEKDRKRRYSTAVGLASDVQKYLADEPVEACPPSAAYRFRKFARRNRGALFTATAVAAALIVAVVGLAVSNVFVTTERDQKIQALGQKEAALEEKGRALGEKTAALKLAEENHAEARRQESLAKSHEKSAQASEVLARRRFYAAQMNLAMQAWETGQRARALELVEGQRPRFGEHDLRTFEWYHLWQLCNQGCRSTLRASRGVAYSPDGRTLATEGSDYSIRILDASTAQERIVLRGHTHFVWGLAFSPDGRTLASGSQDGILKLWDVATGTVRKTLRLGSAECPVASLAFTADSTTLLAATWDITLLDVATGETKTTLPGRTKPQESFQSVAITPDAKAIAAGSSYRSVRLWNWDGVLWREGVTITGQQWCPPVAFSSDGRTLATSDHQELKLWDPATGSQLVAFRGHKDRISSVAFSPDGKTLASASEDRTVRLWDVDTKQELAEYPHLAATHVVKFAPDGNTVTSATGDRTVKVWSVTPGLDLITLQHNGDVTGLVFSTDSKTLYSGGGSATQRWDLATASALPLQGKLGPIGVEGFAVSADVRTLAYRGTGNTVKLHDLRTGQERDAFDGQSDLPSMALSPDGKTLAMWQRWSGGVGVKLLDVAGGRPGRMLIGSEKDISVLSVAFSPDSKYLAAGIQFFFVHVWDVEAGRLMFTLRQDERAQPAIRSVAFSPDGKLLAAGNHYGGVRLWDMESGKLRASFVGHTSAVRTLAFSPDGETLATGSDDSTTKLWDVATGQERITLRGHKGAIQSLAFAPDGSMFATGDSDGTVRLWHAATDAEAVSRKPADDVDDPNGPVSWSRAGDQLRSIGKFREAEESYRRAIELYTEAIDSQPDQASLWNNRGNTYVKSGQWGKAISDLTQANQLDDGNSSRWSSRGEAFAELEQWKEAAEDFGRAIELKSDNPILWYRRALTLLQLRDREAYRTHCADMLAQPALAANPDTASWVVWTCVLAADAVEDWTVLLRLAELDGSAHPKNLRALTHQGALLYRARQYDEALVRLKEAEAIRQPDDDKLNAAAYNWLFQAMACQCLGRIEQANELYDRSVQWFDQEPQRPQIPGAGNTLPWNRRLTFQLLRREAEDLQALNGRP